MNEQDCLTAYGSLVSILSENGWVWIISQVEEQIRLGKTIEREIDTLKEVRETGSQLTPYYPRLKKGPRAKFPVTEPYSPHERLKIIIDAIERAVLDSAAMENQLGAFMEVNADDIHEIQFYDDESDYKRQSIETQRSEMRVREAAHLKKLLDALRSEL